MSAPAALSVIIPAHNEAGWIGLCLQALVESDLTGAAVELLVVANGCGDATAEEARALGEAAAAAGMALRVIELEEGGKPGALDAGDAAARYGARVYLDADVIVSKGLLAALARELGGDAPRYASGTAVLAKARSGFSRAYGRYWMRLPFNTKDVGGFGLFAMTAAGRARWGAWPRIIADDMFARLNFAPEERVKLPQTYSWPLVEGYANLVRVRRRQDRGVREIAEIFPELMQNEVVARPAVATVLARAVTVPLGFCAYGLVAASVKLSRERHGTRWVRGR
ncbi:glycosyltransferase [Roseovarius sp. C7]|uniref:glycosyltransferase n=1 Tax=Roseovarius sp. C7 TaxID=3398643 RepID=UPI0039F4C4C4